MSHVSHTQQYTLHTSRAIRQPVLYKEYIRFFYKFDSSGYKFDSSLGVLSNHLSVYLLW